MALFQIRKKNHLFFYQSFWELPGHDLHKISFRLSFLHRHSPSNRIEPSQQLLQDAVRSSNRQMLEQVRPWPMTEIAVQPLGIFRWAVESLISHQKHSFGITNDHVKLFRSGLLLLSYCEALRCSTCSLCTFKAHLLKIVTAYFLPSMDCRQIRHVLSWNVTLKRSRGTLKVCSFSFLKRIFSKCLCCTKTKIVVL